MQVEIPRLLKRFGSRVALDLGDLTISDGETFGLVGSNGAGKTTFLRLVLDLLRASDGSVSIDGHLASESMEWKSKTGSFLDRGFLIEFLTADEYFRFVGNSYGFSARESAEALKPYQAFYPDEVFGETRLYIREMSMGNAKKIGLIAAMFTAPRLLVLDEPFANLDPRSQIRLKSYIRTLNEKLGTTVIVSSHDLMHVTDVCRRIAILENGRIVRDLNTSEGTLIDLQRYFSAEAV
ncbi:MAG: ABC transporter ATP-binding protein [Rhodothermales bacterium]|nr:ABC transporter ATP-binding protein [Rhodothermales bacterium]